jgi:hypothetical protein
MYHQSTCRCIKNKIIVYVIVIKSNLTQITLKNSKDSKEKTLKKTLYSVLIKINH